MDYENLTDEQRQELNMEYRARRTVPDADEYQEKAAKRSAAVRDQLTCHIDMSYGDTPQQTLDIFPADQPGAPVFFFIHGGYWFQLDKGIYSEVAGAMVRAGVTTVLPNYDLCPRVTIPGIVDQTFRRQSKDFTAKCQEHGLTCEYVETGSDHHFKITDRLGDADDSLTKSLIAQMGL